MIRDLLVVQKISLLEIISAAVLLANVVVVVVVDLLESSMLLTQATLQVAIGCVTDDRQTRSATRTCLTNTPRDAEPF